MIQPGVKRVLKLTSNVNNEIILQNVYAKRVSLKQVYSKHVSVLISTLRKLLIYIYIYIYIYIL